MHEGFTRRYRAERPRRASMRRVIPGQRLPRVFRGRQRGFQKPFCLWSRLG